MKGKIVLVAPDKSLASLATEVVNELNENVIVYQGSFSVGLMHARKAYEEGANIVISRGVTGALIKRNLSIPTVNIQFTSYDVLKSINKAIKYSDKIGVVGSYDMATEYKKVIPIIEDSLPIKILIKTANNEIDMRKSIEDLHLKGCRIFIGGFTVMKYVEEKGYNGVLIETGKEAIVEAINYAKGLMEVQLEEKQKAAILRSIIDFAYDGILGIDEKGFITVFNPVIQKISNVSYNKAIGKPVDEVVENTRMKQVLKSGQAELGEIQQIGDVSIVTNRVPIVVDGEVLGVVATFQEIEKIQKMESQIRKKLLAKGHVARSVFDGIKGNSKILQKTIEKAKLYAKVDSTVLIMGETGTGKELFAQSIHNYSLRVDKPFVAVNCAALPENLLESELFGYVEGAFTGARKGGKTGLFELAHGGTIFLDEISEMTPNLQARFLRVLQEKEVVRIGDDKVIPIDVRVIAATNRNLYEYVEEGKFREDLFYRLCVLRLDIPPLRERKEDIHELVSFFIDIKGKALNKKPPKISPKIMEKFMNYDWPGNVRQLENLIERCIVISNEREINDEILSEALYRTPSNKEIEEKKSVEEVQDKSGVLKNAEYDIIKRVLHETNGNRKLAAEKLGISVTTLWRRLKKLGEQ